MKMMEVVVMVVVEDGVMVVLEGILLEVVVEGVMAEAAIVATMALVLGDSGNDSVHRHDTSHITTNINLLRFMNDALIGV